MHPSFGVPFGQRRRQPPLTEFQKEALSRWSSNGLVPSPWMEAHAAESEGVTVLGPREANEAERGGAGSRGVHGGTTSVKGGVEQTGGRSGEEVLVRFTVQEGQPESKKLCRALGLVTLRSGKSKVADVKAGSIAAKWGVEAGSDIVMVRSNCIIIAMQPAPIVPKPAPTAAETTASRDEALMKAMPMTPEKMMDVLMGKEELPAPVKLEVEMISGAIATLTLAEKNGSSIDSITKAVNGSTNPPQRFTPEETLRAVKKGIGSGKIIKEGGFYKLNPEAPAFPAVVGERGGMISVGSKERSGETRVQELLWCLHLLSDGARAAKYNHDLQLPPSRETAQAWEGLEDDQRKALGIQVKEVLLRDGTRFIEVEGIIGGSVADRHGVRPGDVVEAVGGRPAIGISKARFVLALADALFDPEDQSAVSLRFLLLRKRPSTVTVTPTAAVALTARSERGEKKQAPGEASWIGWVSEKAVVAAAAASMRDCAERGKKGEDGKGEGRAGGSSSGATDAGMGGGTSTQEGKTPQGGEKGKRKEARQSLSGGSGGGRVSAGAAETSAGNLPFRPHEAAGDPDEAVGDASNGTRQRWDEASPLDAVLPQDPARFAVQSSARSMRMQHRGRRPSWWEPRAAGATMSVLKLRAAHLLRGGEGEEGEEQGVEEAKGGEAAQQNSSRGEAVPPGAFLLEGIKIGAGKKAVFVPAGAKLRSVDGIDCANLSFEEARLKATDASSGSSLVFDDA